MYLSLARRPAYSPLPLIPPIPNQRINEQKVRLARRNDVASVCCDVYAEDRVAQRGEGRLCVFADLVEQAKLALG